MWVYSLSIELSTFFVISSRAFSRSMSYESARMIIDQRQSASSWESFSSTFDISRTPSLAVTNFMRSPTSPTKPWAICAGVHSFPYLFFSSFLYFVLRMRDFSLSFLKSTTSYFNRRIYADLLDNFSSSKLL